MPNWDGLSKLIGWVPGASLGALLGGILGLVGFDSMASACATGSMNGPIGPVITNLPCVQTVYGPIYAAPTFAALTGVFGALLGTWLGVSRLPRHRLLQGLAVVLVISAMKLLLT